MLPGGFDVRCKVCLKIILGAAALAGFVLNKADKGVLKVKQLLKREKESR